MRAFIGREIAAPKGVMRFNKVPDCTLKSDAIPRLQKIKAFSFDNKTYELMVNDEILFNPDELMKISHNIYQDRGCDKTIQEHRTALHGYLDKSINLDRRLADNIFLRVDNHAYLLGNVIMMVNDPGFITKVNDFYKRLVINENPAISDWYTMCHSELITKCRLEMLEVVRYVEEMQKYPKYEHNWMSLSSIFNQSRMWRFFLDANPLKELIFYGRRNSEDDINEMKANFFKRLYSQENTNLSLKFAPLMALGMFSLSYFPKSGWLHGQFLIALIISSGLTVVSASPWLFSDAMEVSMDMQDNAQELRYVKKSNKLTENFIKFMDLLSKSGTIDSSSIYKYMN